MLLGLVEICGGLVGVDGEHLAVALAVNAGHCGEHEAGGRAVQAVGGDLYVFLAAQRVVEGKAAEGIDEILRRKWCTVAPAGVVPKVEGHLQCCRPLSSNSPQLRG